MAGIRDIEIALRAIFGGGSNISAANPLQVYDSKVFNSLVVYEGTATADGPDTSTITDTVLAGKPDFNGQLVVITSGDYKGQTRDIDQATNVGGGKVHVAAAFGGTIVEGTTYVILSIRPTTAEVAAIEATLGALKALTAYTEDSVSGSTTNAWADALDLDYRGIKNGAFVVENTDVANSLDYKVLEERANYAGGTDEELQASYTLAFGEKGLVALQDAHSRIKIQVKSTVADTPAIYTIEYLINR